MAEINIKKITLLSMLISLALSLHILESYIPPPLPVPGVKLGLANIITLYGIYFLGFKDTMVIITARCFLGSLFAGALGSLLFSLTGGLLSGVIMYTMKSFGDSNFSIAGISITGGIIHNLGQLLIASIILENVKIFYYFPILAISGGVMGLFVGLISVFSFKKIKAAEVVSL